jgi:hypothetical protein
MNMKRSAIIAASAATIFSMALAAPSFAATSDSNSTSTSTQFKAAHLHASVAVSITDIPSTVTNVGQIVRGAKFVAYKLADDATAIPATQPTTGGKPAKVEANVNSSNVVSYSLKLDAPATAGAVKLAVYNSAGVGTLVTVTTDSAGVATATSGSALTAAYVAPTAPAMGEGKGMKGDRGMDHGKDHGKRMKMGRG